jgi:predicted phage replisome organizer
MSKDKKYFWLKLKENFFRDKEIKKLRKIAGGDTYTIIYLKLQLLSLKKQGKLVFDNLEETFASEMALELDEEIENVRMTLIYLQKCGLIEEVSENEFILPQAIESIGTETQGAERVRRFREKEKLLLCNTPVTKGNTEIDIELDIELDIEKEIEIKKKKTTKGFDLIINDYTSNLDLRNTIINFIKMRKAIKKTLTDNALELILKKLNDLTTSDNEKIEILSNSIMGGWQGVFPLKGDKSGGNRKNNATSKKQSSTESEGDRLARRATEKYGTNMEDPECDF